MPGNVTEALEPRWLLSGWSLPIDPMIPGQYHGWSPGASTIDVPGVQDAGNDVSVTPATVSSVVVLSPQVQQNAAQEHLPAPQTGTSAGGTRVLARTPDTEWMFSPKDPSSDGVVVLSPGAAYEGLPPEGSSYWYNEGGNIPDNGSRWVTFYEDASIPSDAQVTAVTVHHKVTHTWIGDLRAVFQNADQSVTWTIRNHEGSGTENFDDTESEYSLFDGQTARQDWSYCIYDEATYDVGNLDQVELWLYYGVQEDCPDLTPYQPGHWNDMIPIGVSQLTAGDAHDYAGPYYSDQTLYFNWGSLNQGLFPASDYTVYFEVTGEGGGAWSWPGLTTDPDYWTFLVNDQAVGPLSVGEHTFRFWVDYDGTVDEGSNEDNNYYERTINVTSHEYADLQPYHPSNWNDAIPIGVASLGWDATHDYTGPYYNDQTLYFNFGTVNFGAVAATNYTVRFEVTGTGGNVWTWSGWTLDPGYWTCFAEDTAVGPLSVGEHTFKLWLDYDNTVDEGANEGNNYYERTINVASREGPDLTAPYVWWQSTSVTEGESSWVRFEVTNQGTTEAGASYAKAWLSIDNDFDVSDDYYLGEMPVSALAVDASAYPQWDFDMPDLGSGSYPVWVLCEVDSRGEVGESDEGNLFKTTSSFTATDVPGGISGTKWNDLDGDGNRDAGEPGLADWKIYLDTNLNGQWDEGEDYDWTDEDGQYAFTGLAPGTYIVGEVMQDGWRQTYPGTTTVVVGAADGQGAAGSQTVGQADMPALPSAEYKTSDLTDEFAWTGWRDQADGARSGVFSFRFTGNPVVNIVDGVASVDLAGERRWLTSGDPELPVRQSYILLPQGTGVRDLQVNLGAGQLLASGVDMLVTPQAAFVDDGSQDDLAPALAVDTFPATAQVTASTHIMDGYAVAALNIFPVRYDADTRSLWYYPNIEVTLNASQNSDASSAICAQTLADVSQVTDLVLNDSVVGTYTTGAVQPRPTTGILPQGGPYQYVIITSPSLQDEFQALIDQKASRGITSTIVTTDYIYANFTGIEGGDNADRVRDFIRAAVTTWGADWVLLGGDNDVVPMRGAYGNVNSGGTVDNNIPTDLYFSCIDGRWNNDGDGIWGESNDGTGGADVDMMPDLAVGRAPASTSQEATNFVSKVVQYETSVHPHAKQAVFLGEQLDSSTWGDNLKEIVWVNEFPTAEWTVTKRYESVGAWTAANFVSDLNASPHVINHGGHANEGYNAKLVNSDVDGLTNAFPYFMYSWGCLSGAFDTSDAIAEHHVTDDHGAFAVIMNSRYGWYYMGDNSDGPSHRYDRDFWDAVFDEDILSLGEANNDSKIDNLASVGSTGPFRWLHYCITLFGDPETSFRFDAQLPGTHSVVVGPNQTVPNVNFGNQRLDTAMVVGRHIFYNNSSWDGNDPAANAADDDAIATDKVALLPGQTATVANWTAFGPGITGIMIDVDGLPGGLTIGPDDFELLVGNSTDFGSWSVAPAPTVSTRVVAGDIDRITLTWGTLVIRGKWLKMRLKAQDTGLEADDVFYFGNLAGDIVADSDSKVDVGDLGVLAYYWMKQPATMAKGDVTLDGLIDVGDLGVLSYNWDHSITIITPPVESAGQTDAADIPSQRPADPDSQSNADLLSCHPALSAGFALPTVSQAASTPTTALILDRTARGSASGWDFARNRPYSDGQPGEYYLRSPMPWKTQIAFMEDDEAMDILDPLGAATAH